MDHFEMVEKLRQRANVTYEEAKAALEKSDWDILDALVLLENEGRTAEAGDGAKQAGYTTKTADEAGDKAADRNAELKAGANRFVQAVTKLIKKGLENSFSIRRREEEIISLPVLVLILLLIFVWPFSAIALIAGLFLGCRYSFSGPHIGKKINDVMDEAAEVFEKKEE